MNNNTKKYGMGGAVQSFSSPMLAQGMQGGLSGFGTSGLGTFEKGGEVEEFQIGDVVTHKKGKQYGHGKIYKLSSIGFYLEDKYGNKSEKHQIIPSEFKKVKKLADGGQVSEIERILAKYKAMESNKTKEDETSEFLRKSWEGKNIDDYVMYSDKYKRGGKMAQGGLIEHGLQEGDNIVKEVENKWLIIKSKSGVFSVVDIQKGTRFIVGLDDSKMSGKRTSAKAGVKQAMEYINYLKSTKMAKGGTFANGGGLDDAKIYVADLAEYNNGRLVGKWLYLSDYSSGAEVMEAIQEMLDEQTKKDKYGDVHEEYAIHDFEGFPRSFYSEYMGESDFDALYEMMKVADSSNLPLEVLMEAVSDLGYEDDPERVAEAYYSSVPASMGNEWRDFAYEYIDSIGSIKEAVSNPDYYFDFESFGSDVRMDYTDEELEEMGYNDLSDEELGEQMADELGGVKNLGEKLIETYFDYEKFGSELEYDFISVRGKDGNYYFFNRNFAKGGKLKYAKGGEVSDELVEYSIPTWAVSSLINADDSGLEDEDIEKINKFVDNVVARHGNAFFMLGEKSEESNFEPYNDIDRLGSDVTTLYIRPSEKYAQGGVVRNNKFQSNLEELLKQEGFQVSYYDNNVNEVPKEKAEVISLTKWSPYYENFSLKLPSKMEVTFEWIMNKLSNDKIYKSFAENFNKILKAKGYSNLNAYPTTYGIGVFVGFGRGIDETKSQIEELLNSLGIEYTTEYSEGGWVFRYRISKSKENIAKINEIEMIYARGGKIGFEGLAKKVAKRYVGKKVSKEYQAEYGKTYDAKEAKEVGNKVAGKVYQQQVAKKKIVRKLQRKTK